MKFGAIEWLYGWGAIPLALILASRAIGAARVTLFRFLSPPMAERLVDLSLFEARKKRGVILALALALIFVALARPQYGIKPVEAKAAGIDIMILLDTSKSMGAEDLKPDRMSRARYEVGRLVDRLAGNRIGLITFAGKSFVESPLTRDVTTLKLFLDAVKVGSLPVAGTDLEDAIQKGIATLETSDARSRVIILVTDGEELQGGGRDAAGQAVEKKIIIYPVGLATAAGAPIPVRNSEGDITGYKEDTNGVMIVSRLDRKTLNAIAKATGGFLTTSTNDGGIDLSPLIENLERLEKTDIASQEFTEYEERYQIPLALALLLLIVDSLLWERRRRAS